MPRAAVDEDRGPSPLWRKPHSHPLCPIAIAVFQQTLCLPLRRSLSRSLAGKSGTVRAREARTFLRVSDGAVERDAKGRCWMVGGDTEGNADAGDDHCGSNSCIVFAEITSRSRADHGSQLVFEGGKLEPDAGT